MRKREGNRGKKPIPEEPAYSSELPAPPKHLTGDGLAEWKRLAPMMAAEGVLTAADWAVFGSFCHAIQRKHEIIGEIDAAAKRKKRSRVGSEAYYVHFDELQKLDRAFDRCEKQLMKAATELGLSPVTRSKAAREKPSEKDEFDEFDGLKGIDGGRK